jgi:DNA replication and repair protein RecF
MKLLERLVPAVADAYAELAGARTPITTAYEAEWAPDGVDGDGDDLQGALLDAFAAHRKVEVDRGVTLVGPHRDEWRLLVGGMESRTHASQGEQRTLALALRLGGHRLCGELTGSSPVLLLDDVFSELDDQRAVALVAHLDAGQTLVTTAGAVPPGIAPDRMLRVDAGQVEEAA